MWHGRHAHGRRDVSAVVPRTRVAEAPPSSAGRRCHLQTHGRDARATSGTDNNSELHPSVTNRGFTLLELLLATAVAAVVLIAIQTTFFGALRLHNTTRERIEADLELQRALAIVRRDFAGLMLPGGLLSGQLQTGVFSSSISDSFGDRIGPDLFTSSGRIDGWNPFSEVQMVGYFLATPEGGGAGRDLVRAVARNLLPVHEAPTLGDPQILLRGIAEAAIEFYDGHAWTDAWDSEASETLPVALKLRVTPATEMNQPAGAPIELIIPVPVMTSASARAAAEAAEAAGAGEGFL
jgi:type II secretion system protein J